MYRPIYSKCIYRVCCTGKTKKKKNGTDIQAQFLPNAHMFISRRFLLENGRGRTVYSISKISLCTFYFLEHGKYCLYTISLVLIMQNTL